MLSKRVYIYRCNQQPDSYLYLPEKDNFEILPEPLSSLLGELSFSFEFDLTRQSRLVQADPQTVLDSLLEKGYFLQLSLSSRARPISLDQKLPNGF